MSPRSHSWRFADDRMLDRSAERGNPETWCARSPRGMVVTAHYRATAAGAEMLADGGTAADAAVAASLALGVCEPAASGLGGMAMALLHRAASSETVALPGPCRAPRGATPATVSESRRYRGHRAVAVPSLPSVLERLHAEEGRLPLEKVFGPAIRHAEEGYPLTSTQAGLVRHYRGVLRRGSARSLFLDDDGHPLSAGAWIRQPLLAATLKRLASAGFRDFYEGEIARRFCEDMRSHGGFIEAQDLAALPGPRSVPPLRCSLRDLTVCTLPPPGGGLALIEMLNMFRSAAGPDFDPDSRAGAVLMAEVIRLSRIDRVKYRLQVGAEDAADAAVLADPDFARRRAEAIRSLVDPSGETSHICAADSDGNLVSMTQSIERSFGAAEVAEGIGFLHNGFMRGFKIRNPRHPHFLAAGVPARSNACPTILLCGGRPWGAIGSTGSERLASSVFQVLVRLERQSPFDAVHAPRIHATPSGHVMYESGISQENLEALAARGFSLDVYEPHSFKFGGLTLIVRDRNDFVGVSEPRRDGTAAGPDDYCGDRPL